MCGMSNLSCVESAARFGQCATFMRPRIGAHFLKIETEMR